MWVIVSVIIRVSLWTLYLHYRSESWHFAFLLFVSLVNEKRNGRSRCGFLHSEGQHFRSRQGLQTDDLWCRKFIKPRSRTCFLKEASQLLFVLLSLNVTAQVLFLNMYILLFFWLMGLHILYKFWCFTFLLELRFVSLTTRQMISRKQPPQKTPQKIWWMMAQSGVSNHYNLAISICVIFWLPNHFSQYALSEFKPSASLFL